MRILSPSIGNARKALSDWGPFAFLDMIPETPLLYPEAEFQKVLVALIQDILREQARQFILVEKFGLDVAVSLDTAPSGCVRLFEVKAFGGQRMGGVGFGNGRGIGPQVDLILATEPELRLLDSSVRWAYADALQAPCTSRYALLTCATVKSAAMGSSVARGKQNNLRISAFRQHLVAWEQFRAEVENFLLP